MALSNKKIIKIKVVDLDKLYNFLVKNFLIWIRLGLQNSIWNFICRVFFDTRQRRSLPSVQEKHSAKASLPSVEKTLDKEFFKFKKFKYSFCMIRWFQNKKLSTTKFHNFLRSTKFIKRVFPSVVVQKKSNFKIFN